MFVCNDVENNLINQIWPEKEQIWSQNWKWDWNQDTRVELETLLSPDQLKAFTCFLGDVGLDHKIFHIREQVTHLPLAGRRKAVRTLFRPREDDGGNQ